MVLLRSVLIGTLVGIIVCIVLIMLATFVFLQIQSIPTEAVGIMTQLFGAISAFAGGYAAVRIAKEKGFIIGTATGLLLFLTVLFAGMFTTTETITITTATKAVAMAIAGCIGGILGVNKKRKIKSKIK